MNQPNSDDMDGERQIGEKKPFLLYVAILVGACTIVGVLVFVRSSGVATPSLDLPVLVFRLVGFTLLVVGFLACGILSGGIPPCGANEDKAAWWQANVQRALLTWVVAEGLATLGGVIWFLTGDLVLLVGLVGGGLVLLLLNRPQRMMEG